ncbi:hypothetical protein QWZ13_00575 [Reinekea marina]|uniref:hypothetical protein n=1 Tax=Reinekea marina TaxID=1310421 RepID=UPI0025B47E5C|nr:hypothetical protein [Reinekea marina]MDN3647397.1 hypothetical protein [Reinekea marina]
MCTHCLCSKILYGRNITGVRHFMVPKSTNLKLLAMPFTARLHHASLRILR